jgi:uncharacterized SAM-binding protein YcdF (DUF218 family)
VIRRIIAIAGLLWAGGFILFAVTLPRPADDRETDAIVVLTGAQGRIPRGLAMLEAGRAQRLLISGVDQSVKPAELALAQNAPLRLFACCVDLGREAVDTRSNGAETARWIAEHDYKSVRFVTSDWHMRRARLELERSLGPGVTIVADAVTGEASLANLLLEYHKFLARRTAVLVGF